MKYRLILTPCGGFPGVRGIAHMLVYLFIKLYFYYAYLCGRREIIALIA